MLKVKKQYGYAKVLERLIDSAHRVELEHPANAYGGCQLQHLEYGEQLRWKRQHVVDVLERIGKFQVEHGAETGDADGQPPIKVLPVIEWSILGATATRARCPSGPIRGRAN